MSPTVSGPTTEAGEPPSILALFAHPDDAEFTCAGTLALLAARGWRVTIATMTPGDCGSAELSPAAIAAVRRREAIAAATLLGAEYRCLEERDLAIDYDTTSRRKVTALLREVRPRLVLTHPPADYMVDHEVTSRLARDACFTAPMPNFDAPTLAPTTEGIPALYYTDPLGGRDMWHNVAPYGRLVDVTGQMELKRAMLACHRSQRDWLLRQHGMDEYLRAMEEWAAERGALLGVRYAEAFRQHRGHPYPHDDLLAQVLGLA
jgi:N-acetylglucosamine malate deacetylase 1